MLFNFNSNILSELPEALQIAQRAFWYADGLFETMRMAEGRIPWLSYHWRRLRSGLEALQFEIPTHWNELFFEDEVRRMVEGNARIRLQVWRSAGGFYQPVRNHPIFLITAEPLPNKWFSWPDNGVHIGLSENVRLPVDAFSGFKSLNTARYVAASLEARNCGWDDAVLLNAYERVAEASASNIFWEEQDRWYTPPLTDGCVDGVTRRILLERAPEFGLSVQEKSVTFAALEAAEEVFLTNAVRGIVPVASISGRSLPKIKTKKLFELFAGSWAG